MLRRVEGFILLLLISALILTGCGEADIGTSIKSSAEFTSESTDFEMTMLDVGQGLCILVRSDNHLMIYDGGDRTASSKVVSFVKSYMSEHDIDSIDYMIASHYDDDHINGLVGVLATCEVDSIICPDYETDTRVYRSFAGKRAASGAEVYNPVPGDSFELGAANIEVLGPVDEATARDNNRSIVIRVESGEFSAIISGDAEMDEESDIVASGAVVDSDLYVAGHHGSNSSSQQNWVREISPDYVWVSVGSGNRYGHPGETAMATLSRSGAAIYRTDLQGTVTLCYDGEGVSIQTEKSVEDEALLEAAGRQFEQHKEIAGEDDCEYVLNTNSHKFHYPDCFSVKKMVAHNTEYSKASRDELIAQGYSPCGNCHP